MIHFPEYCVSIYKRQHSSRFFSSSQVLSSTLTCTIFPPCLLFDRLIICYTVLGRSFEVLLHFLLQFYTRYVQNRYRSVLMTVTNLLIVLVL